MIDQILAMVQKLLAFLNEFKASKIIDIIRQYLPFLFK